MKKSVLRNAVMVLVIAVMALGAFLGVSYAKGKSPERQEETAKVSGIISMESGSAIDLKGNIVPRSECGDTCSVRIQCTTVLDNNDALKPEKRGFIPQDGMILELAEVELGEGDTAFDILRRTCETLNIQLEYAWTPLYNSYYVEGINQLYEFDCGAQSGWMYEVNGIFPDYGCSSYKLRPGDEMLWCYTCSGLGADVGALVK